MADHIVKNFGHPFLTLGLLYLAQYYLQWPLQSIFVCPGLYCLTTVLLTSKLNIFILELPIHQPAGQD